ncbi:MAG: RNA-binding S4 domain-containing protein [Burkholderiales bacterium]|nr:MAG: RNA-binding S4 domain-containing protein [Burkholderiales bacterium]
MRDDPVLHDVPRSPASEVRLDKWLWAARFVRTRSLAQQLIGNGRVLVGGERVKLARPVRIGDEIRLRLGDVERTVRVLRVSDHRGPAPVAQTMYEETAESVERRVADRQARRFLVEPATAIAGGRPTKRDRRRIARLGTGSP